MFNSAHHPDNETLRLFALGRLSEQQGDEIELHLAGCEDCTRRLDEIERKKSDSVFDAMKAVAMNLDADLIDDEFSPGMKVGHFRLEEQLGRGGMGEAWKAFDETAQRYVVLKFVPKDVQHVNEAMNAVSDSFQKVHALQHSHICPLYMIDHDPEHGFFVVMKYIDGLPLHVYSRRHGQLPLDESLAILRDVADALDYAHSRKVIHRDVKPANIMVDSTDGVQLIDFGLADEIRASQTRTEDVSVRKITGTRSYMAPEQWQGRKQDARTDQYALAVTAYELLAGHVPFSGVDSEVLKNAVLHERPVPIPGLSKQANAALFRGLAKSREDRYENCRAFVDALVQSTQAKTLSWKGIVPAFFLLALILFAAVSFATRPLPELHVERNTTKTPTAESEEQLDSIHIDETTTDESELLITPLVLPQRDGVARIPVIRVTIDVDANGKGEITVYRGFSTLALPFFRGTPFESRQFRKAQFFHGEKGLGRVTFADGDMSTTLAGASPYGWKLWRSGSSYNQRQGSVRFSHLLDPQTARSGFMLGKSSELPCQFTYEVADTDDRLPVLEIVMYSDEENSVKIATISCWGHKEKAGPLQFGSAFTCPQTTKDRVLIIDDAAIEKQQDFSHKFQLPMETARKVKMIEYHLTVDDTGGSSTTAGFDLTLVDIIGRMKGKAGFRTEKRGVQSIVHSIDRDGPAFSILRQGDIIISINGQNDPDDHSTILNSLHFGDPVTVRSIPPTGGTGITNQFHAE